MKNILIIGASGFIGSELKKGLIDYQIRSYRGRSVAGSNPDELTEVLSGNDIIINLAGKSLFTLWTKSNKKKISESRLITTKMLVEAINRMKEPPAHFINASAIGIYKPEIRVDEKSDELNDSFLAEVVKNWESCLEPLDEPSTKISVARFGIVMGNEGGAYKIIRRLTKLNAGAYFGDGSQSFSFIYINDLINAIDFIIKKEIGGVINIVAPQTTTFKKLMEILKNKLNSFIIWSIPVPLIKIFTGEASQMILEGQNVKPGVLLKNNFNFEASDIETCINKLEDS